MPSADVIVLGTGGMGSAACAHLAARGASVIGLDRFPVAHDRGSSHGQTRLIRQAYFEHPDYVPLLIEAYRLWSRLEEETGASLLVRTGLMLAGPASGEAVSGALQAAAIHDLPVERLTAAAAGKRWPAFALEDDWLAVWEPAGGFLRVEDCVRAHAEVARRHGACFESGVDVHGWQTRGRGVVVDTDRGRFHGDRLVITPGPWAAALLRLPSIPLVVLRKSLFWYRPRPEGRTTSRIPAAIDAGLPCFAFDTARGFYYGFPPVDDAGVKVAEHTGGIPVTDPLTLDRTLDEGEERRVADVVRARLPGLGTDLARHAACMYTMTPDSHFLIGHHPESSRVAIAAGFSGHGFKFASLVGLVLAELALDGETAWPIGFLSPRRFPACP
jgi:sarcosine oxidase